MFVYMWHGKFKRKIYIRRDSSLPSMLAKKMSSYSLTRVTVTYQGCGAKVSCIFSVKRLRFEKVDYLLQLEIQLLLLGAVGVVTCQLLLVERKNSSRTLGSLQQRSKNQTAKWDLPFYYYFEGFLSMQ